MLCYLAGMEPYYLKCIKDGPFQPKTAEGDANPESQWTLDERMVVVQDHRLKSIMMSCLPDDIMESVISCVSAKETWTDLVYSFEGPSYTKENRIMNLKLEYQTFRAKSTESLSQTYTLYKTLLNELANDGVNLSKHEINTLDLANIYGRFVYEDNLIQRRYSDTKKALITTPSSTLISTAFFSKNVIQDFQENFDDEVDERSSEEYLRDLDIEYHERALLANSKCYFARDCFSKTSEPSYKSQEEVSDEEEVTQVKVLIALADDELTVGKSHAHNGEWVDITIRKVNTLLSIDEDVDWQNYLKSENYKAQPYQYASSSKQILKAKAKPFPPCTHCGFNDHKPDDCRNYPECGICGSYDYFTSGHNHVIQIRGGVLAESSQSNESSIGVKCNTCGSNRHIRKPIWYLDNGCSRSMTGVKSYLHKYVEQLGPKQGTIFNANKEIVLIAPRRNDVYVLDMSSLSPNRDCFFAKASKSVNWLWYKRLSHLNFKDINKLAKQNQVLSLPSLVYSKDKPCTTCEKGKHHRASFKTKQNFSIRKCLHLLHIDFFGPILSDLKKAQVQKGSKRNQEKKPGSRYSRRTKLKVPILTRF
ncbi:retrovirus-related pol polyprotein from transposon TNT 1-94 [Tanacetum coccineum]